MLSLLPLSTQHSWSTKVEHTFSSADAIDNLASISFSQSNQTPENGNASKIVTTTVTVTYSMSEETALRVCQMFLDAGLMESSGRKQEHMAKNLLWRLTSKGVCILDRFCTKNGVGFKSQAEVVAVSLPEVVVLERCRRTDRLATDHGTINVIFIRFFRTNRATLTEPDSPKVLRARASQPGLKGATSPQRKAASCNPKFTGEAITDWLIEYTTVVDRGEAIAITRLFVEYGLIEEVQGMVHETDRAWTVPRQAAKPMYQVTEHGEFIATSDSLGDHIMKSAGSETFWSELARCSHAQQLEKALGSSAMRLLFREHLRRTHCEENLSFYSDGDELISKCRQAIATHEDPGNMAPALQEIAARACGLYNTFLAPGSPRELNINNRLRNNIATHIMTITAPDGTLNTLGGLITALEEARTSVFNLMTNDSLPKFFESIRDTQTAEDPRILYL